MNRSLGFGTAIFAITAASAAIGLTTQRIAEGGTFLERAVAVKLNSPTVMTVAQDGRVLVGQQGGAVRVIKNDQLLEQPAFVVDTAFKDEQGIGGIATDPQFVRNGYVYVTYSAKTPEIRNRISRFTLRGDVADPASEKIIFEMHGNDLEYHLGGALEFGRDGKLYVAVGEGLTGDPQQDDSLAGKILRLNPDGSIPSDNPQYASLKDKNRAIYARGFRNPFTMDAQPGTGRIFVNDVGGKLWEEINDLRPGANYGAMSLEGRANQPGFTDPILTYPHKDGDCAIVGGGFYNPARPQYPDKFNGKYLYADYCTGSIRMMDPQQPERVEPWLNISQRQPTGLAPVAVATAPDGSVYVLTRGKVTLDGGSGEGFDTGTLWKVTYSLDGKPAINRQPGNQTVDPGQAAKFEVSALGQGLQYQWQRGGQNIPGANGPTYTLEGVQPKDNGARFTVIVSNASGSSTSQAATLKVWSNRAPNASIGAPTDGTTYKGGDAIQVTGNASDPESGTLGADRFTWKVDLHHDTHVHPFIAPETGKTNWSFTIPNVGHTDTNVYYRIYLTVTDGERSSTTYRDIRPQTGKLRLETEPPGLQLVLDGKTVKTPFEVDTVLGVQRKLGVPDQTVNNSKYTFSSWSNGGGINQTVSPTGNLTLKATFKTMTALSGKPRVQRASFRKDATRTIVHWAGDYVNEDTAMQRFITLEHPVNLNGNNNDARGLIPYSETEPISPKPDGGNAYGGRYATGRSHQFYGGVLFHRYDGDFGSKWGEIWHRPNGRDRIYQSADAPSDGWAFLYWRKPDFLEGASNTVAFGPGSSLELLDLSGADGEVRNNFGRTRFVVREGNTFYISERFAEPNATAFTLEPNRTRWAKYAPSAPAKLKFDWQTAKFETRAFNDITAVGVYHSTDQSKDGNRRAGLNFAEFKVVAMVR